MPLAEAFIRSGKVRDLYAIGADRLLLVASDRISAFDVVLPTTIPDKGKVLTGLSRYWFAETAGIVANHFLGADLDDVDPRDWPPGGGAHGEAEPGELRGRSMLCRRVDMLPVEIVVRGYLAGSGWKDYEATGSVCGVALPAGLRESERLPEPIFTPATKAELGEHDENITWDRLVAIIGPELAERLRNVAFRLYAFGAERCEQAGIILADTKFEFGVWPGPTDIILADEVLTPDSSRFWPKALYQPGRTQPSYDKQFVRDYLEEIKWNKQPPVPSLPDEVVAKTREKYLEAYRVLADRDLDL